MVPDEGLYEQGQWPDPFNPGHGWSFTIRKSASWSPVSVNLADLAALLPGHRVLSLKACAAASSLAPSRPDSDTATGYQSGDRPRTLQSLRPRPLGPLRPPRPPNHPTHDPITPSPHDPRVTAAWWQARLDRHPATLDRLCGKRPDEVPDHVRRDFDLYAPEEMKRRMREIIVPLAEE